MKVAVVTKYREEMDRFTDHLAKAYYFTNDVACQESRYTNVYTIKESPASEMLRLLKTITGIDARIKTTNRKAVKVRKAACYLLYNRFNLSHQKIAKLLNYKCPGSSIIVCRDSGNIEVKNMPIELAIRKTLESL